MRSAVARWSILVVGLVAIVVGSLLLTVKVASFGWFTYAPPADLSFVPMSSLNIAGLLVLGFGLVVVAGWVGFTIADRRPK